MSVVSRAALVGRGGTMTNNQWRPAHELPTLKDEWPAMQRGLAAYLDRDAGADAEARRRWVRLSEAERRKEAYQWPRRTR